MSRITKTLILKDIKLNLSPIILYLLLGIFSLWLLTSSQLGVFNTGAVILISMVIISGIHMITTTVTTERNDQVLPFVMSLPISFVQYTHAKICANFAVFLSFWLILLVGLMWVIFGQPQVPDGMAIFTLILMLEMLVMFTLLLSVALVSESQNITVVVMSITNIGLSLFMFWLSGFEAINSFMQTEQVVWNSTAITFVAVELLLVVVLLALTYLIQARKKDFI
ncbi:ABC-2 transporter permease [Marinicella litoralis]|uniref:ABC-2 family transporter n=1 Tax=Marinicella litoralis TaxID=644220 RepID=A0A4R6Y0D7_9GAMM|nr:ABC-2 transporter permease [Marinicella litoralis]TDR23573.1 ABC-2 family transporter [Marinicella litoralis]